MILSCGSATLKIAAEAAPTTPLPEELTPPACGSGFNRDLSYRTQRPAQVSRGPDQRIAA